MSKKRVISRKIRSSQTFASLTHRQRDLWQGLITVADDQGRLPGTSAYVRSQVWPYDDVKLDEVESDLARLEEVGYIATYHVDDASYVQIVNWWKYQVMQWAGASDYPSPINWVDRERYHGPGNKIFTENWESKGGFRTLPSELPSALPSNKGTPREKVNVKGSDEDEKLNGVTAEIPPPEPPPKPVKKGKSKKKRDPRLDNPAIIAYREEFHYHIQIAWREEVCNTVDDPERWEKLIHTWNGKGWNPKNVEGMLQAYRNGGIGSKKKSEPAGYAGLRDYAEEEGWSDGETA